MSNELTPKNHADCRRVCMLAREKVNRAKVAFHIFDMPLGDKTRTDAQGRTVSGVAVSMADSE